MAEKILVRSGEGVMARQAVRIAGHAEQEPPLHSSVSNCRCSKAALPLRLTTLELAKIAATIQMVKPGSSPTAAARRLHLRDPPSIERSVGQR